jgi:hypothetical protein
MSNAKVQFLDTGHFAIETHVKEIASAMQEFLEANGIGRSGGAAFQKKSGSERGRVPKGAL